ncbi:DUF6292 family protein [Amycolatopsis sp. A133]|uniref:DUF6292 family protein n=1 Tax=Amycolatopsis sp. A133 TaxID=3064472 RepID=UPI00280027B0|nr:DUF6292 family protein [Amycolatopsis sp. A133]MDQ7802472.1 DUF6292 family protein [Amycolatopsis sp. A133]
MTDHEPSTAAHMQAVAAELGLQPEDTRSHTGDFAGGQIRLAGLTADRESSDYLLRWTPGEGWQLAAEDGPSRELRTVAELPGRQQHQPESVADFVLTALTSRGERPVRRSDEPGPETLPREPAQRRW